MARVRKRTASLMTLQDPKFLSLVDSPANKTGFKVIRSTDEGEEKPEEPAAPSNPRRRKVSRNDSSLLAISFPEGVSEAEAVRVTEMFDLGDDYTLTQDELGNYILQRSGDYDMLNAVAVELSEGLVAHVDRSVFSAAQRKDAKDAGVTVARVEFSESEFPSVESVKTWLAGHEVDFEPGNVEVVDGGVIVTRHETDLKTRSIEVAPGVSAKVIRSPKDDIPRSIERSVVETAYGNWGWGHLDFSAAMADPEFTDKSWDALGYLRDVLENIVFTSNLPLEERKTLIHNALGSFYNYMSSLMDVLPREVITQARSDLKTPKENDMAKPQETKAEEQEVKRSDDKAAAAAEEQKVERSDETGGDDDEAADKDSAAPITRDDVRAIVAEVLAATNTGAGETKETAKRSEDAPDPTVAALTALAEGQKAIVEAVTAMRKDVDDLSDGETISRADSDDASTEEHSAETAKRSGSVFSNMFGDRFAGLGG